MLSYPCPKCQKTLNTPEDQAGKSIECMHCGNTVLVPKGGMGKGMLWTLIALGFLLVSCPICIIAGFIGFAMMGTSASGKFSTVASSISAS